MNDLPIDDFPVGIDSDSIVASCDCMVKSPNYLAHRRGCKYRLICERDEARQERDQARKISQPSEPLKVDDSK